MANLFPRNGRLLIANRTVNLVGDTIKMALLDNTYATSEAHTFMDMGGATGPVAKEITSSGYSRQSLGTKVLTDTGSLVKYSTAGPVDYGAVGTGSQTIGFVVMFKDAGGADTANPVIAVFDVTDIPTNGGEITQAVPANGWLNF